MAITLRISVLAILAAWLSVCAAATDASVRWFSEDDTVLRVTGSLSRRVAGIEGLRGLAATNDGGAWAASAQRLVRFAPDGNTAADLNLPREGHGRGGARTINVASLYNTDRYRPIYTDKLGSPLLLGPAVASGRE